MKILLIFTFVLTSKISCCQIQPDELINVLLMDFNQFETFSLENKFELYEHELDGNFEILTYEKHNGIDTNKLTLQINTSSSFVRLLNYQLSIKEDFLSIKKFLIQNGTFENTSFQNFYDDYNQTVTNYYVYNTWKFALTTAKKNNKIFYSITLH
jgi:hypothetical protein